MAQDVNTQEENTQEVTPEQLSEMQANMEKMQEEQIENARKQQEEQIKMLQEVIKDFSPVFLEYVNKAVRTESTEQPFVNKDINHRIAHSIIGINTELSELNKAVQLSDKANIIEELGDILWYVAIAQDEINFLDKSDNTTEGLSVIMSGEDEAYTVDVMDLLKRSMFYGSDFNTDECAKPYCSILLGVVINSLKLGIDLTVIMDTNLKKLYTRYPEKFTAELAELRDLEAERKVLDDSAEESK